MLKNNIRLIEFDLVDNKLTNNPILEKTFKYHLIHCAASVNLGNNSAAEEEIKQSNYLGTIHLIDSLLPHLFKVSYVSTAFSSGHRSGVIEESFLLKKSGEYRNPFEGYKAQTEKEIVQICEGYGLQWQIFRPSIICGRLLDYPKFVIPKFLVFYLFGTFFYRTKTNFSGQPIRITINSESGLNIIPVDYASKAMVRALNTDIKELNIASEESLPNTYAIPTMLKQIGWDNFQFTDVIPEDQNMIEKLYYKTVNPQLHHYLVTPNHSFNVDLLNELMHDIPTPKVKDFYPELVDFAINHEFNNLFA